MDCSPPGSSVHSPGKYTGVGCHVFHQGIFPTLRSNSGLLHCRWILYCLSHQGSPTTLASVAYPFSRGSSQPRNWIGVSCIAGRLFMSWASREVQINYTSIKKKKKLPLFTKNQGSKTAPSLTTLDVYRHLEYVNSKEVKVELLQALWEGMYLWTQEVLLKWHPAQAHWYIRLGPSHPPAL